MVRLDWRDRLVVGDVISERGGPHRIVRHVVHRKNGLLIGLNLTIRHCSWTHRCYTAVMRNDLKNRGFRKVHNVRVELKRTGIDRQISRAIGQVGGPRKSFILTCCDVEGIP